MCDTFVSLPDATTDGSVILGKNSDREPNEAHEIVMLPASDPESTTLRATYIDIPQVGHTHAVLLSKPYWIWGAEMGVNEHGVAIGNEAVFTKAKREKQPGLLGMDLLRLGLERAVTADEAIDVITNLLEAHGQGGQAGHTHKLVYDNSFIVSDRSEAWILETVGREWAAERVDRTGSISNGLTLGTVERASSGLQGDPVTSHSDFLYTRFSDSAARQCRTSDALDAVRGRIDVPTAMHLLRDHGGVGPDWTPARGLSGQTVCAHAGFGPIRVAQSTGSMVSHVTGDDITVWLTATSAPCTSVFKPVWFDGGLPELKSPGKQFDPQTLWWRHELLHRTTLRNYPERSASYTKLRDDLEAEFLAGAAATDDRAGFTAACFDQASDAEDAWLQAARTIPEAKLPRLYDRAWRAWDRLAGMP
ncbi:MAG: C69 family dipeptidase [Candidatus Nanopelagicales bacterium]|nr:C69 family dipeptidase [Actinomycetota bacterium]MCB0920849.1 C69 family dipeptidase [Actinomycetota bacterium]